MELHEYTTEDLKEELRRRRLQKNGEWYYVYEDEGENDPEWKSEVPQFLIVNKRTYHLQHKLQVTSIAHFLKLPKGFSERYASHFEYRQRYGDKSDPGEKAKKLLDKYGFCQLKNPVLGDEALLVEHFNFSDKGNTEIRWHVEREDMKKCLDDFLINHPWGKSVRFVDYMQEMRAFASAHGYVAYFFNDYTVYVEAAFLPADVFASLPKNPYNRREGEE